MKPLLAVIGVAALALAGCANMPAENSYAAESRECKAVAVYTASEAIRNEVRGTASGDSLAREEGAAGIGRIKANHPYAPRSAPGTGVIDRTVRGC